MPRKCEIENCSCCFHKTVNVEVSRPRGRPPVKLVDENHKRCRVCAEVKEISQMRKNRNDCLECYNNSQKDYYKRCKAKKSQSPDLLTPDDLNLLTDYIA